MGVDFGQANDFTAVTVMERAGEELHIPYLTRPELRTSYERIAAGVVDRLHKLEPVGAFGERRDVGLCVDATGVGRAVVDMLSEQLRKRPGGPRVSFWPVVVTGGNRVTKQGGYLAVPKRNLITAGVVALQSGRLKIGANVEHKDVLIQELRDYRLKINVRGHDQYEPWREGAHDDLLFSMCLAAWAWSFNERKESNVPHRNRSPGAFADALQL
jgi:hypothetical protein